MLLKNFSECIAKNLPDAEERVDANAKGSVFQLLGKDRPFVFEVNVAKVGDVTLISAGCDVPCRLTWVPAGFVRQSFQLRGRSNFSFGKITLQNDPDGAGCLIPADTALRIESGANYESFTMRVGPEALRRKLSALIGEDVGPPEFDYSAPLHDAGMRSLRLAILELAREMDQTGMRLAAPALEEFAQTAIVRFLLYHKHNHSDQLVRRTASPSERQLERIEDYIVAHWNKPLEIEKLADISSIGARTIFRLFAKQRGFSPSQLIRKLRLNQARILLLSSGNEASVLETAMQCGFHSFGHFAREYRQAFGERPIDTLLWKRARPSGRRNVRSRHDTEPRMPD